MTTARSSSLRLVPALAAALVFLAFVPAARASEDLEQRVRDVASGLRCPVCQNLSVADSTSDMAREMRALILDELRAGKSAAEIRAYFVEKYGQWILLSPTPRGFGLLVWVVPGLGAIVGLGAAAWVIRGWARRRASRAAPPVDEARREGLRALVAADDLPAGLAPEEARPIEALRELEFDHRAGKLSDGDYAELRGLYEARAAETLTASARARAERRPAEIEAERAHRDVGAEPVPRRAWRWAAGAGFLLGFGVAIGFFLTTAVRPRGEGSVTGEALTGTGAEPAVAASRDPGALVDEGQRAMAREDYRRAMALFTRALEIDPAEPTAHAHLGLLFLRGGHAERALASFDRALERDPISAPALWGKGLVLYESMGRPAEALRFWETLLTLKISDEDRKDVASMVAEARKRMNGQTAPPGNIAPVTR